MKCPLAEANLIGEKKKIKIGWTSVKVSMLPARKMQCFRCLRPGHTKARCDAEVDRSDLCYNCGQKGHKSNICNGKTNCILCEEDGKAHNHRLGRPRCTAPPSKGCVRIFRRSPTKSPITNRILETIQNVQDIAENNDTNRIIEIDKDRIEDMETEEIDNSVESELVEDHYGVESATSQHQPF